MSLTHRTPKVNPRRSVPMPTGTCDELEAMLTTPRGYARYECSQCRHPRGEGRVCLQAKGYGPKVNEWRIFCVCDRGHFLMRPTRYYTEAELVRMHEEQTGIFEPLPGPRVAASVSDLFGSD